MATIDSLPPELLRMILTPDDNPQHIVVTPPFSSMLSSSFMRPANPMYATHKDYLALRLVSRTFNAIVTPFAFAKLRIESPEASLSRLTSIASDPHLRHHVKEYEFAFWREPVPAACLQHEYLYIQSLRDDEKDQGYEELNRAGGPGDRKKRVEHYAKQLEFSRDGNMARTTLKAAAALPNLQSLAVRIAMFSTASLLEVPSRIVRWGPPMVEAFFRVLSERAEQKGVKPIQTLILEGLTMECFVMPADVLKSTCRGVETLTKIHLTLAMMAEPALSVLGRILQCAKNLKSLHLTRCSEVANPLPSLQLRSLFAPPRIDRSCKARDPVPPPVVRWKFLEDLTVKEFIFSAPMIIEFAKRHPQLKTLVMSHCYLQPFGTRPCPHHIHPIDDSGDEYEVDPETETWQHVFREIHAARSKPFKEAQFSMLTSGKMEHVHLSSDEANGWAALLTGRRDDEPEKSESRGLWCDICNPQNESGDEHYWGPLDLSDESDMDSMLDFQMDHPFIGTLHDWDEAESSDEGSITDSNTSSYDDVSGYEIDWDSEDEEGSEDEETDTWDEPDVEAEEGGAVIGYAQAEVQEGDDVEDGFGYGQAEAQEGDEDEDEDGVHQGAHGVDPWDEEHGSPDTLDDE
jgi:hypothetical protein